MLRVRVEADLDLGAAGPWGTFGHWKSYTVEHDLRQVFPTVRLTAGGGAQEVEELGEALARNPTARIRVDGTLVATCRVTSDVASYSRGAGRVVSLVGSGLTQAAAVDAMPLGWRPGAMTIAEAAADIMRPVGVMVVAEATQAQVDVARRRTVTRVTTTGTALGTGVGFVPGTEATTRITTTVADDRKVRPRVGETRLGFLRRMLTEHKLLCWETPDGKLFIGLPQPASAEPALTLTTCERDAGEGRIREVSRTRRYGTQHTMIRVVGRGGRGGSRNIDATATDATLIARGWNATAIVEAADLRGQVEAQRRADLAMSAARLAAFEVQVKISGHGQGASMAAMDRNVAIHAPEAGLRNSRVYCIRRSFEHSRQGGTLTSLTLVRRGLWSAGQ
uniref:Tail protein n=1 Tax=viral metagenome TaxID=1070528 RepID=A0A6M3IWR2_9ZZZZ